MAERGRWEGVLTIVRFNWPWYALALALLAATIVIAASRAPAPGWTLVVSLLAAGAAWFLFASLAASHVVYDRSDLYRFGWLARALGNDASAATRCVFCHSGFDECSAALGRRLPQATWRRFDHYAAGMMTEPSIQRARRQAPPGPDSEPVSPGRWPVADATVDVVFAILAVHELRHHEQRVQWFVEAHRCLDQRGQLVLVEHVRDVANLLAYGPGALHFHSVATWRKSWEAAGLACRDHFRITPFVRVFVLNRR